MFCCFPLKRWIENAGANGIATIVYKVDNSVRFEMQFRTVASDAEESLKFDFSDAEPLGDITTVVTQLIKFCPFCGTELATLVTAKTRADFDLIVQKHQKYILGTR
jgi:hypothetical protein